MTYTCDNVSKYITTKQYQYMNVITIGTTCEDAFRELYIMTFTINGYQLPSKLRVNYVHVDQLSIKVDQILSYRP